MKDITYCEYENGHFGVDILNPNCSEVIWRLEVKKNIREEILKALEPKDDDENETFETDGENYPNGCVDIMIREMKGAMDVEEVKIIYEENQGREGVSKFTQSCFDIARSFTRGEITREEVDELEKEAWKKDVERHRDDEGDDKY